MHAFGTRRAVPHRHRGGAVPASTRDARARATSPSGCWRELDLPEGLAGHEAVRRRDRAALAAARATPREARRGAARAAARRSRAAGRDADGAPGCTPPAAFGDAQLVDLPRYARVGGEMRGLLRRTPECALHVHVGMPDPETAIRVLQRPAHPPPAAGRAGGQLAVLVRRRLRPRERALPDGARLSAAAASRARSATSPTTSARSRRRCARRAWRTARQLWWDVRPHPRLGTVEVREMDAQTELRDVAPARRARALPGPPRGRARRAA